MIRPAILTSFFTLGIALPVMGADSADFPEFGALLQKMSENSKAEAFLRIGKERIIIVEMQERSISEKEFKTAALERPEGIPPRLRFSGELEGIEIPLESDSSVIQYSRHGESQPSSWVRRDPVQVAAFPRKDWRRFLEAALGYGLSQYRVEGGDAGFAVMHFRGNSAPLVETPFGRVIFPRSFYESMQRSARYPERVGTAGFVVLVHEPHADFVGQKAMLRGLHALKAANSDRPFEFLVEGTYERPDRKILFNGLDDELDAASGGDRGRVEHFVLALLEPHIIDGPMAYRLLYDRAIPAWAIDDNLALREDVGGGKGIDPKNLVSAVMGFARAARDLPPAERQELDGMLGIVLAYVIADLEEINGSQLVAYYDSVANLLDALVKVAPRVPGVSAHDLAILRVQAKAYSIEYKQYNAALVRDATLGQQIVERCKGSHSKLSLAFIGSFHTEGVTRQLQKANIGYVVVEPRIQGFGTAKQEQAFQRMIHPATRAAAIRKALDMNTGQVTASESEVKGPIRQFLSRPIGAKPERIVGAPPTLNVQQLRESLSSNTMLSGAVLDLGGGGAPPVPPQFKGAFAFFDPGSDGGSRRFVLLDGGDADRRGIGRGGSGSRASAGGGGGSGGRGNGGGNNRSPPGGSGSGGWKGNERYEFLKHAIIVPATRDEGAEQRAAAVFFQDPTSSRMFAVVHDKTSGKFYMMEAGDALDVLSTLGPPARKKGKDARVHIRLSEILSRESKTETIDV